MSKRENHESSLISAFHYPNPKEAFLFHDNSILYQMYEYDSH